MRDRLLLRNLDDGKGKYHCDICGAETTTEDTYFTAYVIADAYAGLLTKKHYESAANKALFPDSLIQSCNGLLCCRPCGIFFEKHEISIDPDFTIRCSDKVLKNPEFKVGKVHKYAKLQGTKVAWANKPNYPTPAMLKWRLDLPEATSRRALMEEFGLDPDDCDVSPPSPSSLLAGKVRKAPESPRSPAGRKGDARGARAAAARRSDDEEDGKPAPKKAKGDNGKGKK